MRLGDDNAGNLVKVDVSWFCSAKLHFTKGRAIEQAVKDLNETIMPIGAKMYEAVESDAEKSDDKSSKTDKKAKKSKKDKDEPIEGEVVND